MLIEIFIFGLFHVQELVIKLSYIRNIKVNIKFLEISSHSYALQFRMSNMCNLLRIRVMYLYFKLMTEKGGTRVE